MNQREIEKLIPHRSPFLWIDRIEELEPGIHCVAWLAVDGANPVFAGHFPARPILPGVLLIGAVAQTAAVMLGAVAPDEVAASALLAAVNRFKFFKPAVPGMLLRIETTKIAQMGSMTCIEGAVSCDGEKVASGELLVAAGK